MSLFSETIIKAVYVILRFHFKVRHVPIFMAADSTVQVKKEQEYPNRTHPFFHC
jgi:bifunctional DNase/RNase